MNLIDHLPRDSYFVEALLSDDDFGEQMLDMPEPSSHSERLSEWSSLREGLARVEDALHHVSASVIAAAGAKPPTIDPAVRPITAIERARRRRRVREHEALVARVLPGRS